MRRARRAFLGVAALIALALTPAAVANLMSGDSVCRGSTSHGALEGAAPMPLWGPNYRTYCYACALALRTYGHELAIAASVDAYDALARSHPETRFVFGEIGFPWGGPFYPHRTHQNGLSVDYMTPLENGRELPTHALNRFGFDVEFSTDGALLGRDDKPRHVGVAGLQEHGRIDFDAMAAHLLALDEAARKRGGRVRRVFFAPDLQDELFASGHGGALRPRLRFNERQSWVRHDDHYHVDFDFPCKPLDR